MFLKDDECLVRLSEHFLRLFFGMFCEVYASTFSKGDGKVGLIVINRKSSSAKLALGGIESLMSSVSEIRGWVVTSSDSRKAERSRGSKWNGVSSSNSVGGPFPISNIKALTMTSGYISLPASLINFRNNRVLISSIQIHQKIIQGMFYRKRLHCQLQYSYHTVISIQIF